MPDVRQMSRRVVAGLVVSGVIAASAATAVAVYRRSPTYAVNQIANAVETRNRLRFQNFVDLDRFAEAFVDQVFLDAFADATESAPKALGSALGVSIASNLKPVLVRLLHSRILEAVENGSFAEVYSVSQDSAADLSPIAARTAATVDSFQGLTAVTREGGLALIGLRFQPDGLEDEFVLRLRMEKEEGRWRIVAPEDLDSYIRKLGRARVDKLETENRKQQSLLDSYVTAGKLQRNVKRIATLVLVKIELTVENRSREPVWMHYGRLYPPESSGAEYEFLYPEADKLEPGESTVLRASPMGSKNIKLDPAYLSGDLDAFSYDIAIAVQKDGAPLLLKRYRSWGEYLARTLDPEEAARRVIGRATGSDESAEPKLADWQKRGLADSIRSAGHSCDRVDSATESPEGYEVRCGPHSYRVVDEADGYEVILMQVPRGVESPEEDELAEPTGRREAGPWFVAESTDPLDDSPTVTLLTQATSHPRGTGDAPTLVLRCLRDKTEVYISWHDYLGSSGSRSTVESRIDDAPSDKRRWRLSTDSRATFYPGSAIRFIKQLQAAERLVARVTPYNESPVTASFDVGGLTEKVKPLVKACHWEEAAAERARKKREAAAARARQEKEMEEVRRSAAARMSGLMGEAIASAETSMSIALLTDKFIAACSGDQDCQGKVYRCQMAARGSSVAIVSCVARESESPR
jgi:type VI secretion system protein VasI